MVNLNLNIVMYCTEFTDLSTVLKKSGGYILSKNIICSNSGALELHQENILCTTRKTTRGAKACNLLVDN